MPYGINGILLRKVFLFLSLSELKAKGNCLPLAFNDYLETLDYGTATIWSFLCGTKLPAFFVTQ